MADKPHEAAIAALTLFISKFEPATIDDADIFYSTLEISDAVQSHTGVLLMSDEIYELMSQMGYQYQAFNGLEFRWMMKGE